MQTQSNDYKGIKLVIRYCEEPPSDEKYSPAADQAPWFPPSLLEALAHFPPNKHGGLMAKLAARRKQLADEGRLRSPDYFNTEGELPNGKHFFAIKADRLRAYGWFSSRHKDVFFISHFAFKKGQKLDRKDSNRVIEKWREFERPEE